MVALNSALAVAFWSILVSVRECNPIFINVTLKIRSFFLPLSVRDPILPLLSSSGVIEGELDNMSG